MYVGIARATALIKISFPPIERSLPFQPASFLPILSFKIEKTCFFDLPIREGRPRYLVSLEFCIGPRILKISSLVAWAVLGLKKMEDLSVFTFYPEASSYSIKIDLSMWHSSNDALQKSMLSSTKRRWVTFGQPLVMEMPVMSLFLAAW